MKLVIDGNSLLNVVVSGSLHSSTDTNTNRPFFRVHDKWVIKDDAAEYYNAQIYKYLLSILNGLSYVDYICVAIDSVSWRKFFYKKCMEHFKDRPDFDTISLGYKGNRSKSSSETKDQIKELVNYLSKDTLLTLSKKVPGIQLVSVKGLEGDDIVYILADHYKKFDDVVVWTNDSDITDQVLDKNVFVIGSNDQKTKKRKLYRIQPNRVDCDSNKSENTEMNLNFIDNSFNQNDLNSIFDNLIKRGFYIDIPINPKYETFNKILCGDKSSDNIAPSFCIINPKTNKIVNLTRVKYSDKIYNHLKENLDLTDDDILDKFDKFDDNIIDEISKQICILFKIEESDNINQIKRYIKFNIRMIRLSKNTIPEELTGYLYECIKYFNNSKFYLDSYVSYINNKKYINNDNRFKR